MCFDDIVRFYLRAHRRRNVVSALLVDQPAAIQEMNGICLHLSGSPVYETPQTHWRPSARRVGSFRHSTLRVAGRQIWKIFSQYYEPLGFHNWMMVSNI
jgi:hypothetical protein